MDRRQSIKQNKFEFGSLGDQILKTSSSFERLRRQSSINTMISFGNNQGAMEASRSQERSEMKKKVKMIEQIQQRVPQAHLNRNEVLKKQFSIEEKTSKQNEEFKQNVNHFQNLYDELLYSNEQKLKKLQEFQKKSSVMREEKIYEGQPNSIFTSSYQEEQSQQLVDVRAIYDLSMQSYDCDVNFQAIFERAQNKKRELEQANLRINNETDKENQMKYSISCIQKNKIHLDQQVNDLNLLHKQYDQQIHEINDKATILKKQNQFQNYNKNQISKLVSEEIEINDKLIQSYKNSSDKESAYIKEELKNFNLTQDQVQKIQKKLESQEETIKQLDIAKQNKLVKISNLQTLSKIIKTIQLLYKSFVEQEEEKTDFDFNNVIEQIDLLEMEEDQLGTEQQIQKEQIPQKEVSYQSEDFSYEKINLMTQQLIKKFQSYEDENEVIRARIEDLLQQKNQLINKSTSEQSQKQIKQGNKQDETTFQQKIEFNYLEIVQQDQENQQQFQNSKYELADLEYLLSKCYLFVGQILFRFCRALISVRQLIYQIENKVQEEMLLIRQKQVDESQGSNQSSHSSLNNSKSQDDEDDQGDYDEEEGKLSEIINSNQRFFSILDVIMNYIQQTNQVFESPVNYTKSSIYKESKKQESNFIFSISFYFKRIYFMKIDQIQFNKNQKLQNLFKDILCQQQDCEEEFFDLIKKDLIIYYFCKLRNYSEFFKQMKTQQQEKIQEEKMKQLNLILKQKEQGNGVSMSNFDNHFYDENAFKINETRLMMKLITENIQLLKKEGQQNFLKIINNKFSYIIYLIKTCCQQNLINKPIQFPKILNPKNDLNKALLQKQKSNDLKYPPQKRYDWKSEVISKKIQEIQTQKGYEDYQIKIISKRASLLTTRNISTQQSSTVTTVTSPFQSTNNQKLEQKENENTEEDYFLLEQNKDQKKIFQQEINEILETNSSTNHTQQQPFQNYLEQKIRLQKIQNEEKDLQMKRKKFEKDCNLILKMDNQPFLTYFDIKYGFQTQRQLLQKPVDNGFLSNKNSHRKSLKTDIAEESKRNQELTFFDKNSFEKFQNFYKLSELKKMKETQHSQRSSFSVNTEHTQYSSLQNTPKQSFMSKFNNSSTKNSFRLKEEFKKNINVSIKNYIEQKIQQRDLSHQSKEKFFVHKRNNSEVIQFNNKSQKANQKSDIMNRVKSNSVFDINHNMKKQSNKSITQNKNNTKVRQSLQTTQYDLIGNRLFTEYYSKPQSIFQ